MRTIGSYPGAGTFRSVLVIIISIICAVLFLFQADHVAFETERIAKDQIIVNIKQALAAQLYDYAIKGKLDDLEKFDRENPFVPLAIYRQLPSNYFGTVTSSEEIQDHGWYFDLVERKAIYRYYGKEEVDEYFELRFEFDDKNKNRQQDQNEAGYLTIKKA